MVGLFSFFGFLAVEPLPASPPSAPAAAFSAATRSLSSFDFACMQRHQIMRLGWEQHVPRRSASQLKCTLYVANEALIGTPRQCPVRHMFNMRCQ